MNFSIVDPFTGDAYSRDPRNIAAKAEAYLKSTGIADTAYFGAEAEFYVFDDVRFETKANASYYYIDSIEAAWNSGREEDGGNRGYKTRFKGGYFPVPPVDHFADIRDKMCLNLAKVGLEVERSHHEVGTAGQQEINYRFNTLLQSGDDIMKFKYVIKNTAWDFGKTATFMPKPIFGDNGSGMHTHQSLWKDGEPLFYDERGYGGLSDLARWYIGGLLKHAPALLAFTNPTINSYHRLVPGYEAPVNLVYSARNRSACVRIPITGSSPKAKRIEFRVPDPSSNPYLCFAAQLMAGLDGIRNRIEPRSRWTRTSTSCRRRSTPPSSRSPALFPRCSTRSRPTTSSCSRATCSRRTSSRPGSSGSARTRSTRSASARTRTSSRCTSTSDTHGSLTCWLSPETAADLRKRLGASRSVSRRFALACGVDVVTAARSIQPQCGLGTPFPGADVALPSRWHGWGLWWSSWESR